MRMCTHSGKFIHDRTVNKHRALEVEWRSKLLPHLHLSFYMENRPPSPQRYLSAKHLPNADLIYKRLNAERNRHREIIIKLTLAQSLVFLMFYKRWARRRFKNVKVQLMPQSDRDGILISWDGLAKKWKEE